jgi:threonine dehydratase
VITASAGNHAQGVAYAGQQLGVRSVIVMPATTPEIKVAAVRRRGGEVILHGDSYSDAEAHAYALQAELGLTFVHPYDDPLVIAGQGTVGLEISQQISHRRYRVFVPVGGGGLIAGIAVYLKTIQPEVEIVAVEPDDSDAMFRSVRAGERITLDTVGIFVDGVAVRRVGAHTFDLTRRYVDHYVRVTTDEVCAAIKDCFDETRAVLEPAGALAVAGMKRFSAEYGADLPMVALTCGANVNFDRLRHIAERTEIGEQREAIFAVTIPERPGSFKQFIRLIGQASITEFNYRFAPRSDASVFVGIQCSGAAQRHAIAARLQAAGYPLLDLTNDELAIIHLRHMVGGRAPEALHERLYSFEFPERPGALLQFLESLDESWNISLFHYRNHASAHGRVLAGIQVSDTDLPRFQRSLQQLGYASVDQSANPAYRLFLT